MAGIAKQRNQGGKLWRPWYANVNAASRGRANGYRSGLEEKNAKWLEGLGVKVNFEDKNARVKYEIPASSHTYTPDFVLPNGIIVETKGKFEPSDRAKHLLIKQQHPELDIRFVFQRPSDKIRKGSKTTYADWCNKNGFRYAFKLIPKEWIDEPSRKGPGP
jgi:hypothetical protein